jgi:uncharacterized protein YPO0396
MDTLGFDFVNDPTRTGFRLHRAEVFNWGTFNRQVWHLEPGGSNCLVTGDIGSGKSTLVDAITTLLVPAQRITYNKAAGAESRERSLRSYVLGHYKSERADSGLNARPVPLRDHNAYSVILGHFRNEGFDRDVTLAQVFYMRDPTGQPDRFYICADIALRIAEHFANFGEDLNALRKRLRELEHVELFNSFPPYEGAFRRRMGIENPQALELFNQTVSMKSVGNLTEFVREHMLQPEAVAERIDALIRHFDDLDRAHAAVLRARDQIDQLTPIIDDINDHAGHVQQAELHRACRDALGLWFARHRLELLEKRSQTLDHDITRLNERIESTETEFSGQQERSDKIRQAIRDNGGDRLEQIRHEIEVEKRHRDERKQAADRYQTLADQLELSVPDSAEVFDNNRQALTRLREPLQRQQAEVQDRRVELEVAMQELRTRHADIRTEIESLKARRNNLPAHSLAIREQLCQALDLPEDRLPFAGELIGVLEHERDWEGAIERLLHNFALSLLVPDEHYGQVAEWVDRTRLRGRLVYFRVHGSSRRSGEAPGELSLLNKIQLKPDTPMRDWLDAEIRRRFDYVCAPDLERFRRERQAITRAGQIKSGTIRHEKDDRHDINDRTRFVLGWRNEAKIAALTEQREGLEKRIAARAAEIAECQKQLGRIEQRLGDLGKLEMFERFERIDWRQCSLNIDRLDTEARDLEAQSDILAALRRQRTELDQSMAELRQILDDLREKRGGLRTQLEETRTDLADTRSLLEEEASDDLDPVLADLDRLQPDALGEAAINLRSIEARQREYREFLQTAIDREDKRIARLQQRIVERMSDFRNRWPQETGEFDAAVEAGHEYRAMLERLQADDLPAFEERFKALLNENTIREVTTFQAELHRQRSRIGERIETINRSLHEIDYEKSRYIHLLAENAPDTEIRDFIQDLRSCTEGTSTGTSDDQYSEQKFLQVKAIIERFRGREGFTELDRRWTRKVTDVRNWFVFSASERWRDDDSEHEHYTDSGGKSGGQKEKLAYTVLAASLAYQFGLEWGEERSRSFRFVVIDEAFGRGSDESARYGLELFQRLNLQLLIVTPLQKIHIIEPYVASVGYVHNPEGKESLLRNLSIEQLQRERAARKQVRMAP